MNFLSCFHCSLGYPRLPAPRLPEPDTKESFRLDRHNLSKAMDSFPIRELPSPLPGADFPTAWVHPLEALVELASNEPGCPAIRTHESVPPQYINYGEVWRRAYSIANGLKSLRGWAQDSGVVALHVEPEEYWVYSTYAVWILGKKTINFGLNWPPAVRSAIVKRHGIKFLLYRHARPEPIAGVELVAADSFPSCVVPAPSLGVCSPLQDSLGYLSTSGSTGIPKTFLYSKPSDCFCYFADMYRSQTVVQSPSFSATTVLMTIASNCRNCLWFPKPTRHILDQVQETVQLLDSGVQKFFAPTSYIKLLLAYAEKADKKRLWTSVLSVMISSEMIQPSLVARVRAMFPNATLSLIYASSESTIIGAAGSCIIHPFDPLPEKITYVLNSPTVHCALLDDQGDRIDPAVGRRGVLCLVMDPTDPIAQKYPFDKVDAGAPFAAFGFFEDRSPRLCTMDEVELVADNEFTVVGRFGHRVKINGVYVHLDTLQSTVLEKLGSVITDCAFVLSTSMKIVFIYVASQSSGSKAKLKPREALDMVENLFVLENVGTVPLHNCISMEELPYIECGKRNLCRLKEIADSAEEFGMMVYYPPIPALDKPVNRAALKIAEMGAEILGNSYYATSNYFFSGIGFDSLTIVQMALKLRDEFGVKIPPHILVSNGATPLSIARLILDTIDSKPFNGCKFNLTKEVDRLNNPVFSSVGLPPFEFPHEPRSVLLTGADSLLGIFLLFELAWKLPQSRFVCLVATKPERNGTALSTLRRIAFERMIDSRDQLRPRFQIWDRVEAHYADLAAIAWGLPQSVWADLAEDVDMIIHNAETVHWVHSYEILMAVNVGSTMAALQLASTHHLKVIHYISTTGVLPLLAQGRNGVFYEERIYHEWRISGGYNQTKWVSEQLLDQARQRGIPSSIIRLGIVLGDSRWGACDPDCFIWHYIEGCISVEATPSHLSMVDLNMDCVDHVAQMVATICTSPESVEKFVFHAVSAESQISEQRLFETIAGFGWNLLFETRHQFRESLYNLSTRQFDALDPLMDLVRLTAFNVDNKNALAMFNQPAPAPSSILQACLQYLVQAKQLPAPTNTPQSKEIVYPPTPIYD